MPGPSRRGASLRPQGRRGHTGALRASAALGARPRLRAVPWAPRLRSGRIGCACFPTTPWSLCAVCAGASCFLFFFVTRSSSVSLLLMFN